MSEYAKIIGTTNTVLFETWNGQDDYSLNAEYRDTNNYGQNGAFAVYLGKRSRNLSFTGIIIEASVPILEAMEGEAITLTVFNKDLTGMTFKLKTVSPVRGLTGTSVNTAGVVNTTYVKHEMKLTIMRET